MNAIKTLRNLDFLKKTDGDDSGESTEKSRKKNRQKNIGWIGSAQLRPVCHDAHGNQGKPASIQHEEQNLRIAGDRFVDIRIQFLQLFHGFESHRGGRIVQSEHIGADVHEHGTKDGMPFGNFGKEPCK